MPTSMLRIYKPSDIAELETYKPYDPANEAADFTDGDQVWCKDIVPGCLVLGEVRGISFQQRLHAAYDVWIVDFGAPISEVYQWTCACVWSHQMLKRADSVKVLVAWASGQYDHQPKNAEPAIVAVRTPSGLQVEVRDMAAEDAERLAGGFTPTPATVPVFGGSGPRSTMRFGQ